MYGDWPQSMVLTSSSHILQIKQMLKYIVHIKYFNGLGTMEDTPPQGGKTLLFPDNITLI
jgi:hypothetical protein